MPTPIVRRAGSKPNRVVKAKKNSKRSTPHTKNYRFQSFNERITNLKIDPIRRKRHVDREEVDEEKTHSYFGSALEAWKDTNLSQTFTDFAREATPLSDNLPVVLHNEEKIMDLLVGYIERGDALAMEPLLALLAHLAHDLDTRFEVHFQRAVSTVAAVAAKHEDFAVIEWAFTCLAWLFKYLSRLLTPDLRPLYDLLAPYLGQKEVKPFIVRFTAEALSFLLRKAAVVYQRDEEPLDRIMEHMLKDCKANVTSNSADLLQQGTMTLLTEAIKGVQHGIHTGGIPVVSSLFKYAEMNLDEDDVVMENVVSGILTSLIHHCMDGSFQAILDVLLLHIERTVLSPTNRKIRFCSTVLFTVISVRKGSRISDWKPVMTAVKGLVSAAGDLPNLQDIAAHPALSLLAVALQTSSIDAVLSTTQMIESLRSGQWANYFLAFCDMVLRLGFERFDNFVLPHLQKFMLEDAEMSPELCTMLPRLTKSKPGVKFKCPETMIEALLSDISVAVKSSDPLHDDKIVLVRANAALSALPHLSTDRKHLDRLDSLLDTLVRRALQLGEHREDFKDFALGPGLQQYLQYKDVMTADEISGLWSSLCAVSSRMESLPNFWSNMLQLVKKCSSADLSNQQMGTLEIALVGCLCSSSHSIRSDALDILQTLYQIRSLPEPDALAAAITIESTPISLDTARSISMNVRRLASEFTKFEGDDLMVRAIPTYCFGLLHVHLSQAWDDATTALASICQSKAGEDVVIALAQSWIDGNVTTEDEDVQVPTMVDVDTDGFKVFSDFECPNLAKLSAISKQVFAEPSSGLPSPSQQLALDMKHVPTITATTRSQALKVLHKIPQIAEKRSRILVPVLLKWAGGAQTLDDRSDRWSRKDQKAMLAVFSQFVNPSVLFRSNEVHTALLALCANGDVEIQQSALKAILAWKNTSVARYKEHLNNLLDEARFREELSVFLRGESREEEEEGIRPEDHADLMPVLLRVLYGRAVAGGKEGQAGRRKAIFVALSRFGGDTLEQFLDIALSSVVDAGSELDVIGGQIKAPLRQQLGMMYMLNDMLQVLGGELEPSISKLMNGILACTASASRMIERSLTEDESPDLAMLRSIRQTGIQCLVKVFATMSDFDTKHYGQVIADNLLVPRLEAFANENAQSVSGSLRLIAAWTDQPATASLFASAGGKMLESVAALLQSPHSKDEVRLFILQNILDNLFQENIDNTILQPQVSGFVQAIGAVIEQQPNKEILDACVKSFSMLAERITSQNEAVSVTRICTDLLKKPGKAVSPWIKTGLLKTLAPLIERFEVSGAKESLYPALCALFSRLKDAEARVLLADVLAKLVRDDVELVEAAGICADLNALGLKLDQADHEKRDLAFKRIYEDCASFTLEQWLPMVHNCLFYIRDGEDRVNRTSSSRALELYIDAVAQHDADAAWTVFTEQSIVAGIEFGIKEQSELVRSEYLAVLGHLVEKLPTWQKVQGMQGLLVGGDEEASVFTNLLHIQQHRRLRALRRIKEEATNLGSSNISKIWIPLIEHFVFDADGGDAGRGLADEGVLTIGALATALSKTAFRGTFTRYAGYLKTRPEFEKIVLRLLGALVDGKKKEEGATPDTKAILSEQLPPLMEYLHKKDESTVDRRMPVAVTIVKLLIALPEEVFKARLPAVLTDVSHVLRSKSQEARDQTRKALASIASLVGSQYFGFILKELRSALKRGPQLHVLSYTVHSLLVQGDFETGELDECLPHLMMVVMDDVFGATAAEKDAEEYRSAMKEVKSSKSFDTLELLARKTAVGQLGTLIAPIRGLLEEKVDLKTVKKVDELLVRLRKGLDLNPESSSRSMLVFCWEIVRTVRVETEKKALAPAPQKLDERVQRYLIQPEAPKKSHKSRGATASYSFKLTSFSLNLLRKILKRHEDLQTPQNLQGFLPIAGDALVAGHEEVKLASLRFLATIMRIPGLKDLDENAPVYLKESFALLAAAPSIISDSSKAALELITSVLRDRRTVEIRERNLAQLLKKLKTDIDEPDQQVIVYKFLRAVLGRKIVITEVYEILDAVGEVMVQNPTASIREAARSAYLQFVLEFPQGKDRWTKQLSFLTANLKFEHASGRISVLEFLGMLVGKVGEEVLREISGTVFVNLMPVLCSDSDEKCRALAGILIGRIFERVEEKECGKLLAVMGRWSEPGKKLEVRGGALQCWTILLPVRSDLEKRVLEGLRGNLEGVLEECVKEGELVTPTFALHALRTMATLVEVHPEIAFSKQAAGLWDALRGLPVTSETMEGIQESVATLLGTFFTDVASSSSKTEEGLAGLPLRGSGGLEISVTDLRQLCSSELRALRAIAFKTSEVLVTQIVRNLVFLGRCFAANGMLWSAQKNIATTTEPDGVEEDSYSEDEPEEADGEAPSQVLTTTTALEYLFRRLASALQADKFALASRTAALATISSLLNQLDTVPALPHVLRPLYNLTDTSIPQPPGEAYKALAESAQGVMDGVQKKIGAEKFVEVLGVVRGEARARREGRRIKRRIEKVSEPERWAREKKRKYEGKKVKAKAKGVEERGRRRGW